MQNIFNHLWKIFSRKNIYVHISDVLFQEEKEKMKLYLTQLQMYNCSTTGKDDSMQVEVEHFITLCYLMFLEQL